MWKINIIGERELGKRLLSPLLILSLTFCDVYAKTIYNITQTKSTICNWHSLKREKF